MTAHVAEATEGRGRIILRFSAWTPNAVAIDAAMLVAQAYHSEVEILFIEDSQRLNFAGFSFAREFSLRGGAPRTVSPVGVRAEAQAAFAAARKRAAAAASKYDVPIYEHIVRDDPIQALVSACARRGPWNMIVITETLGSPALTTIDDVFDTVADTTGVILAGPRATLASKPRPDQTSSAPRAAGPVVVLVEDTGILEGMLRTARHIAAALDVAVMIMLTAPTSEELARMDGEVRLVLGDLQGVHLAQSNPTFNDQSAVAEVIRRAGGSFVIAEFGGVLVPRGKNLRALEALQCPLLLVR